MPVTESSFTLKRENVRAECRCPYMEPVRRIYAENVDRGGDQQSQRTLLGWKQIIHSREQSENYVNNKKNRREKYIHTSGFLEQENN